MKDLLSENIATLLQRKQNDLTRNVELQKQTQEKLDKYETTVNEFTKKN